MKKVFEDPLTNPWIKEAKSQKALNSKRKFPKSETKFQEPPLSPNTSSSSSLSPNTLSPRPVPAPRTKKIPPVPQPRTKVAFVQPQPREEEKEPPRKTELDLVNNSLRIEIRKEEVDREIRCQKNLLEKRRLKYPKWFLDKDVNIEKDETMMLLFNADKGIDLPVKNYKDIAEYFKAREYMSFLKEDEFTQNLHRGKLEFIATTKEFECEEWIRFILIKDPCV